VRPLDVVEDAPLLDGELGFPQEVKTFQFRLSSAARGCAGSQTNDRPCQHILIGPAPRRLALCRPVAAAHAARIPSNSRRRDRYSAGGVHGLASSR